MSNETLNVKKEAAPEIKPKAKKGMPPLVVIEVDDSGEVAQKKERKVRVPREPKEAKPKNYLITEIKAVEPETKMPLQCKQIMAIISEAKSLTLNELVEKMKSVVQTRQPYERIFTFYRPRLLREGYIFTGPTPTPTPTAA